MSTILHGDLNGDTPLWIRVLYRYGVPAAIALFLVWSMTSAFGSDLHTVKEEVHDLRYFMRLICVNTAKTEADRAQCVAADGK